MPARLVIAVHDIAPGSIEGVRFLLLALDRVGARPRVLKVIPKDLPDDPGLQTLLRDEQARGSEIVLHGYSHQTAGRLRGRWPARLRARLFAPHDAEFLSLAPADMTARLRAGRDALRQAGLEVTGFCPPGWLASPELPAALRAEGFRYAVGMTAVVELIGGRRIPTAWLGYMGSAPIQERLVGVANALARRAAPRFGTVKVFLHPQRAPGSAACRRVLEAIPELMKGRTLLTYGQLVGT